MRINHNISAMVTQGALSTVGREMSKSLAKLSTGLRINTAADDAAGLGVSENLRTQVTGMGQALKNTQDAISMLNIADGALNEQANILQRMRELVIQGMNDTYSSTERAYMGQEFVALRDELDRIAGVTNFNTMKIFAAPAETQATGDAIYDNDATNQPPRQTIIAGSIDPTDPLFGAIDNTSGNHFNMMVGANASAADVAAFNTTYNSYGKNAANMVTIQFGQMDANGLLSINPTNVTAQALFDGFGWNFPGDGEDLNIAIGAMTDGDIAAVTDANVGTKLRLLLKIIDGSDIGVGMQNQVFAPPTNGSFKTGLARVGEMRARIGAMTNRLEHSINNTINQVNNTQSAESLVRDADFAEETAKFTKNQILTQSATAMLAQANSEPKMILDLLK